MRFGMREGDVFTGVCPSTSRPGEDGGTPGPGLRNPPPFRKGQQSEYLLHGGGYASCVHAGGLSCNIMN